MDVETVVSKIPTLAVDAVCVAHRDREDAAYSIVWMNDGFCRMFATTQGAAQGSDPFSLCHPDYAADFKFAFEEMLEAGRTSFLQDTLCLRKDGSSFWGGVSFVILTEQGTADEYLIKFVRDIDSIKQGEQAAELALIENEHLLAKIAAIQDRLMAAINTSQDHFCIFDTRDRLVICNSAFAENVTPEPDRLKPGTSKQQIVELRLANGYFDDALDREAEFLQAQLQNWQDGNLSETIRIRGRDYKTNLAQVPNGDRVVRYYDVTEQLRQQREMERYATELEAANREIRVQAMQDELTGLGNRRYLLAQLDEMIAERRRTGLEIAALHIDLDRFKAVNDSMGHAAGDHVLQHVASVLRNKVRGRDTVARIGGDEFIILMMCSDTSDSPDVLAERLIEEIIKPIPYGTSFCRVGASVGIARTPMISTDSLLTCSDIALYKAKSGGRAMKAVFDQTDLANMQFSTRFEDDVMRGLNAGEFQPVYQPQIDVETGAIVALEVLACWNHPQRGLLSKQAFSGMAMEAQIDLKIDAQVHRKAIEDCQEYFASLANPPALGLKSSVSRLMDDTVLSDMSGANYGGRIAFELTETVFLEAENSAVSERLQALRDLGISVEVDSFGSGRASIVGLRRFAPDMLRIDHRLIEPITTSESAGRLVGSLVEIGAALGIKVAAAGVKTQAHYERVKELGCVRAQGAFFAEPGPLPEVCPLMAENTLRHFG